MIVTKRSYGQQLNWWEPLTYFHGSPNGQCTALLKCDVAPGWETMYVKAWTTFFSPLSVILKLKKKKENLIKTEKKRKEIYI